MSRSRRRVSRIHLARPVTARLGSNQVVVVDISILGARVEHTAPLGASTGAAAHLSFFWDEEPIEVECRVVRSRLERFSIGADGLTIFHSGLEFIEPREETRESLKRIIGRFITRALHEQKLNARGVIPGSVEHMPIFRYGQLTENKADVAQAIGSSVLPKDRIARETGYVCLQFDNRQWKKKRTHDPGQPNEGFTVSASEDQAQVKMLCDAYEKSDRAGRKMIQLFAQLSIIEGEGIAPGRFVP